MKRHFSSLELSVTEGEQRDVVQGQVPDPGEGRGGDFDETSSTVAAGKWLTSGAQVGPHATPSIPFGVERPILVPKSS